MGLCRGNVGVVAWWTDIAWHADVWNYMAGARSEFCGVEVDVDTKLNRRVGLFACSGRDGALSGRATSGGSTQLQTLGFGKPRRGWRGLEAGCFGQAAALQTVCHKVGTCIGHLAKLRALGEGLLASKRARGFSLRSLTELLASSSWSPGGWLH